MNEHGKPWPSRSGEMSQKERIRTMTRKTISMAASAPPPRRKSIKIALAVAMVTLVAFAVVVFAWLPAKIAQAAPAITISGSIGAHDPSRIIKDGNTYYV